jgi:hypothetical protein
MALGRAATGAGWLDGGSWPAGQASLPGQPSDTHTGSVDRSEAPMSKRIRALVVAATLAAMNLAGLTAVAHAQATDQQATRRPPTERQVGESWRHRPAVSQDQAAADAALKRVLARERFSIPNPTPAEVPAPVPPKPSRPSGWLFASLGVLVATLGLAGGLAVRAARRTRRRARLEHAA